MLLIFVVAVLACTSTLTEARAEDTYNFYFQKAPGPTVVNQGTAGPTNPKDVVVTQGAPLVSPTAPSTPVSTPETVGQAMAAEASPSSFRSLEISLGAAGSEGAGGDAQPSYSGGAAQQSGGGSLNGAGQYVAGLQWNWSEHFAIQAEAFRLVKRPKNTVRGVTKESKGDLMDYSAGLVITPFRLNAGSNMKLAMSGLLGAISLPFHKHDEDGAMVGHSGSFYYGARLGFEMWNRVALQASIRKVARYGATHGTATVAFLF